MVRRKLEFKDLTLEEKIEVLRTDITTLRWMIYTLAIVGGILTAL
jgi:hypothetical protein